jgi:type II secretory pathway pseudopilin PulG
MVSTYTTNKNIQKPGNGDYVDTWNVPVNADFNIIDTAFGANISFNATAGSQTLTSGASDTYSYIPLFIKVTGAISASVTYTIPSGVGGQWVIYNATTDSTGGPWTVTFASAGGGLSVIIPRFTVVSFVCDGTNIYFVSSGTSGNAVPTGGGANKVFYPNDQTVTDSYTMSASQNYGTFGPVTVNTGVTVTVPAGATWTVV